MTLPFLTLLLGDDYPVIQNLDDGRVVWWDRRPKPPPANSHANFKCPHCHSPDVAIVRDVRNSNGRLIAYCSACAKVSMKSEQIRQICPFCNSELERDLTPGAVLQMRCVSPSCTWKGFPAEWKMTPP